MHFSKSLMLGIMVTGLTSNSFIAPMATTEPQENKTLYHPLTTADHLISEAQRQLDQIAIIFVTLSGILNTNQVTLSNKPEVLQQIRKVSSFISNLRDRKFADADVSLAYEFLHINNLVMEYTLHALNNNFKGMGATSLESLMKSKPAPADVDVRQAALLLMKNQQTLTILTRRVDTYGLSWYNKAYRVLDDYVITPCNRHSIPQRAFFGATATFLGLYLWWRLGNESFTKNAPSWMKKFFGDIPGEPGMSQANSMEIRLGNLEHILNMFFAAQSRRNEETIHIHREEV